jgi:hypothetical protein
MQFESGHYATLREKGTFLRSSADQFSVQNSNQNLKGLLKHDEPFVVSQPSPSYVPSYLQTTNVLRKSEDLVVIKVPEEVEDNARSTMKIGKSPRQSVN